MTRLGHPVYYPVRRMLRLSYSRRFLVALLALAVAVPAVRAFPPNHHKRNLREEVEAVDRLWRAAELNNDAAAMEKLLSDDYIGVTAGGRVLTKAQQLDRMRSRQSDIHHLDVTDVKVKLAGNSVAIITSTADLDGVLDGHPVHGRFRSMRVYQRGPGGAWRITNFEATPLRNHPPASAELSLPSEPDRTSGHP